MWSYKCFFSLLKRTETGRLCPNIYEGASYDDVLLSENAKTTWLPIAKEQQYGVKIGIIHKKNISYSEYISYFLMKQLPPKQFQNDAAKVTQSVPCEQNCKILGAIFWKQQYDYPEASLSWCFSMSSASQIYEIESSTS